MWSQWLLMHQLLMVSVHGAATTREERDRLLHIVVVGGGPTGVEFAGELSTFVNSVSASAHSSWGEEQMHM